MNLDTSQVLLFIAKNIKAKHLLLVLGVLVMALYSFIAIYLLSANFFNNNPLYISILIAIAMGITLYLLSVIPTTLLLFFDDFDLEKEEANGVILLEGVIYGVLYISPALFISYYAQFELFYFLCTYIGIIFIRIALVRIVLRWIKKLINFFGG